MVANRKNIVNSTDSDKKNDHLTVKYEITPIKPIPKQKMVPVRKGIVKSTDGNKKNEPLTMKRKLSTKKQIPEQKMVAISYKNIGNASDSNKKKDHLTIKRKLMTKEPIPEQKMVAISNKNIVNASDSNKKKDRLTIKRKLIVMTKEPIPELKMVAIRKNIVQVLINSNVMPFIVLGYGYKCFYCYQTFIETEELKNHQIIHLHDDDILLEAVDNFSEIAVHVDVTDLFCKLCSADKNHLYDLIDHLTNDHGIEFNKDVGPCMKPFKLNNQSIECVICSRTFKNFKYILFHMNNHHGGLYRLTCEECGRHFRRQVTYREHLVIHRNGTPCNLCGDVLKSGHQIRSHMQNVHGKKYKCGVCAELFETHYKRLRHMIVVHKNKQEIKCLFCDKSFLYRSHMMLHLRRVHLMERNSVCHLCGWRSQSECKLKLHMMRHSSENHYKCSSCEQAYRTSKSLKKHIRTAHEN